MNDVDSAIFFNNLLQEVQPENREMSFRIANKIGDIETMAEELSSEYQRQTDFVFNALNENLAGAESEFFKSQNQYKQQKLNKTNIIIYVSATFTIFIFIVLYVYHHWSINRQKLLIKKYLTDTASLKSDLENSVFENDRLLLKLNSSKDELEKERKDTTIRLLNLQKSYVDIKNQSDSEKETLNSQIVELKHQLKELDEKYNHIKIELTAIQSNENSKISKILRNEIIHRFSLVNEICSALYQGHDESVTEKSKSNREQKTIKRIIGIINELKISESVVTELEDIVNRSYDGIITKFKEELPELYKNSRNLYLYKCLSLPVLTIAYLLGTNERGIYDRTYQLKRKIIKMNPLNLDDLIRPLKH